MTATSISLLLCVFATSLLLMFVWRHPMEAYAWRPLVALQSVVLVLLVSAFAAPLVGDEGIAFLSVRLVFYSALCFLSATWWFFVVRLAEQSAILGARFRPVSLLPFGIAGVLTLLIATNPWHGRFITLEADGSLVRGPVWWLQMRVNYVTSAATMVLLLWSAFRAEDALARRKFGLLFLAPVCGLACNAVFIFDLIPFPIDLTTFGIAVSNGFVVAALYSQGLLGLAPDERAHLVAHAPAAATAVHRWQITSTALAFACAVGSAGLGLFSHVASTDRLLDELLGDVEHLARDLVRHSTDHRVCCGVDAIHRAIEAGWHQSEVAIDHPGSAFILFRAEGASLVSTLSVPGEWDPAGIVLGDGASLRTIAEERQAWGGRFDLAGESWVGATLPIETVGATVLVMSPVTPVERYSFAVNAPWLIGVLLVGGLIIPLTIGVLNRAATRAQLELARAHESRLEMDALYHRLVDGAPIGILTTDHTGQVQTANDRLLEIMGSPSEEATRAINLLTFPLLVESGMAHVARVCLEQGHSGIAEFPYTTAWGKTIVARFHFAPLLDKTGAITGLQALVEDVTEQHNAEEALHKQESLLNRAQEMAHLGSWEWDIATGGQLWSDEVFRIYGVEPQAFVPTVASTSPYAHPEDFDVIAEAMTAVVLEGAQFDYEYRIVRTDGEIRWIHSRGEAVRDSEGNTRRVVGIMHDITDLRQAAADVQRHQAQLERAQEIAHFSSFTWNVQTDEFEASREVARLLGVPFEELGTGLQDFLTYIHEEDLPALSQTFFRAVKDGGTHSVTIRMLHADGSERIVESQAQVTADLDGEPRAMVGTFFDVTEQTQAARELERRSQFESLLLRLATEFVNQPSDAIDDQIAQALQQVLSFTGDEGAYLFQVAPDGETGELTHECLRPGLDTYQPLFSGFKLERLSLAFELLRAGEVVNVPTIAKVPEEVPGRDMLLDMGIESIIGVPVFSGGALVAVLGLGNREPSHWSRDDVSVLRVLGEVLLNALERQRAHETLRESERGLTKAQEIAALGSWEWDLRTGAQVWSDEIFRMYGIAPGDVIPGPDTAMRFAHPDDLALVGEQMNPAVFDGAPFDFEYRIVREDGEQRWVHAQGEVVCDELGAPQRILAIMHDVTERKHAEAQLLQRAEFDRILVELATDFMNVASEEIDAGVQEAMQTILRYTGDDGAYYFEIDDDGVTGSLRYACASEGAADHVEIAQAFLQEFHLPALPYAWECLSNGKLMQVAGPEQLAPNAPGRLLWEHSNLNSIVVLPLMQGGSLVAGLGFTSIERREEWAENILALLRVFGEMLVSVLAQKRVHDEEHERENRFREQRQLLAELAGMEISSEVDLRSVLDRLMQDGVAVLDCLSLQIWAGDACDAGMDLYSMFRADGVGLVRGGHMSSDMARRFFQVVASPHREYMTVVHDIATDETVEEEIRDYRLGIGTHAVMESPLRRGNTLMGVVVCTAGEPREWTPDEQSFFAEITDFVALAMEMWRRKEAEALLEDERAKLEQKVAKRTAQVREQLRATEEMNAQLTLANQHKSQFLSAMSHELRTPLNSVLGFSDLLLQEFKGPLTDGQREYVAHIDDSGSHLLELINDLLDMAKIDAGEMVLDRELLSIAEAIDMATRMLKTQAEKKGLEFVVFQGESDGLLYADPRKLKQILLNLLTNAVKYTPEGGRVTVEIVPSVDAVAIAISDTGVGIPPKRLGTIFDEFQQADPSRDMALGGIGLGLALTRRLVELHGGSIDVESEVGVGSCFRFTIPREDALRTSGAHKRPSLAAEAVAPPKGSRIMVVEDNAANLRLLLDMLSVHEHQVTVAHDGQEALDLLDGARPELIFMDLHMPRMDGFDATRYIRAHSKYADIPIIALSASPDEATTGRCLEAGCTMMLGKPVQTAELFAVLAEHLGVGV